MEIVNPIIRGFNPDPSICRVGEDYYIATSTFEWFPGVQIHHSRDLVNWRLITHALTTREHLDMKGMDNSEGVYAPTLSYHDGQFFLCFANTHSCRGGSWMATPSYIVSADNIYGPWSKPTSILSTGFDPSLFRDDDGKTYILNMLWDGRKPKNFFGGIFLQEIDLETRQMLGSPKRIFGGSRLGLTEGPQMLKKDGYYYLVTAEGGTSYNHGVTVCRSRTLEGPYELHPQNPVATSRFQEDAELQRTGHGFFVQTQTGEWYMTHLCGRPIMNPEDPPFYGTYAQGRCILGRESSIQKAEWRDGWPYLISGQTTPEVRVPGPNIPEHPWPKLPLRDSFTSDSLDVNYSYLREPFDSTWGSLTKNPGHLRLYGRQYLYSRYEQSLVARRLQAFKARVQTAVRFEPKLPMHMAGLVAYYARTAYYFLKVTANDEGQKVLQIVHHVDDVYGESGPEIVLDTADEIHLRLTLDVQWYQFSYSTDGESWTEIGPKLNSTHLSDEGSDDIFRFTGTMVGMFAADVTGQKHYADFSYFEYEELDH